MAAPEEEQRRAEALDKARNEGADAWSPSRAREAIRAWGARYLQACPGARIPRHCTVESAENIGALDNQERFEAWACPSVGPLRL